MENKTKTLLGVTGVAGVGGVTGALWAGLFAVSIPIGAICGALAFAGLVLSAEASQ